MPIQGCVAVLLFASGVHAQDVIRTADINARGLKKILKEGALKRVYMELDGELT